MADIIVAKTVIQSNALNDLMHENATKVVGVQIISQQNQWSSTQFKIQHGIPSTTKSSRWQISSLHHHTHYEAML
jgi:hypothetical protein